MARGIASLFVAVVFAVAGAAGEWSPESNSAGPDRGAAVRAPLSHARVKVAIPANGGAPAIIEEPRDPGAASASVQPEAEPAAPAAISVPMDSGDPEIAGAPASPEVSEPRALAIVNGAAITDRDVQRELWESRGRETLEWLIGKAVLEQELARLELRVEDAEVESGLERHLARLRRAFPNLSRPDDLTRSASGMLVGEYRRRAVWTELALGKIMRVSLAPDDAQLRAYFAERQADFIQPERVRISQVFIAPRPDPENDGAPGPADWAAAERQILEAHSRLRAGEDFSGVARAYGAGGQQSRWVERGDLLRELEDAAFSLSPGSLSGPIKTGMGYHIIRAEKRLERNLPRFEDARAEVLEQYEEKRFVILAGEFMVRLRERALKDGGLLIGEMPDLFPEPGGAPGAPGATSP